MLNSWSCLAALIYCWTIWLSGSSEALQHDDGSMGVGNSIAAPGQPLYYLMADVGPTVGPNDELKRTNRSLMKWWDDLFGQNNCCNNNNNLPNNNINWLNNNNNLLPNNCNGLQLQNLDPFKQMKLFKKLPDLFGNNCGGQCGQCGAGGLQPVNNYVAPVSPGYGGDGYAPAQPTPAVPPVAPVDYNPAPAPPSGGYETPNPAYDGPGDGDAGYVAPPAPPPAPAADSYEAPPTSDYAAPPASSYEAPDPAPPTYEPAAPAPAPESYSKVDEYAKPEKSYGGAQPPQIVYQPIIYLTASPGAKAETEIRPKPQVQSYEGQTEPPQPLPVYQPPPNTPAPTPVYAPPPAAAPAPHCNSPACGGYLPLVGVPFYSYPAPPAPPPAPVYAAPPPAPVYAPTPVAPPAPPAYASSACQTPIRLSLYDQPYRVAPELFREYNYRLSLADNNRL
ncbi:leucine-rich repeat extensin-like protein 3 [Drosophila innubila]|uniref:leucine-rich repeat extensin-like protein 3 n=1 Tax=Drosophila innubila TaxID=198719 RepID=UPI00148C87E0|nr:leucine-rich repeat extensin-like protein 3 [Drosophila innubila]